MTYDAPTPNLGLLLPDLTSNQKWQSTVVKGWFSTIDAAFGEDRGRLDGLEGDYTDWVNYEPAQVNLAVGNGTRVAKWRRRGKMIEVSYSLIFGTTTSIGSDPRIPTPSAAAPWFATNLQPIVGTALFTDSSATSAGRFPGEVLLADGNAFRPSARAGGSGVSQPITNTFPFVWTNSSGNSDSIVFTASYPIA